MHRQPMSARRPTKAAERMAEERRAAEEREAEVLAESRRIGGVDDAADGDGSASKRPPSRQARAKKPTAPTTPGVRGGTSSKPIGRRRDQQ